MPLLLLLTIGLLLSSWLSTAQPVAPPTPTELVLSRDSVRQFFGLYEFEPNFQLRIFSENTKLFGQRVGDAEKFQLFARQPNVFFLKVMPAELEFRRAATGRYDVLVLHQGGHDKQAHRLSAQPVELYDTVLHLDSLLYGAYNRRDLPAFMAFFAPTLEFYHDQTGYTTYPENLARFQANFNKTSIMRRELIPGSLEVYPIKDFGAIEIGTHRFYQTEPGQLEKLVGEPKFMQVWKNTQGRWQLVRVVSYDH